MASLPKPDLEHFYRFSRLDLAEQSRILATEGVLVDVDDVGENIMRLYFIYGFFVEQFLGKDQKPVEHIPYRQGYKASQYLRITQIITPRTEFLKAG